MSIFNLGGVGLTLFLASALIGGAWIAYNPTLSWPFVLMMLGSAGFFLIIATALIPLQWAAQFVVIAAGLVALYFVSQYAHFPYENEVGRLAWLGRVTGSLSLNIIFYTPHPNAVAAFLEGAFLLGLELAWRTHRYQRFIWAAMVLVIGYGVLISDSRGAWTGLAVVVGLWALLKFAWRWPQFAGLGVGLAGGLILSFFAIAYLAAPLNQSIPFLNSIFHTGESRLTLYRNSLALWGDYPFTGIGPGDTFAMVYSRYQLLINVPYLYYAHNLFLSVGLGQGIVGLAGLVLMLVAFYRFVIQVERIGTNNELRSIFQVTWLGVTASLIHGLTDSVQFSPDFWTMPMIFALAGVAVAAGDEIKCKGTEEQRCKDEIIKPLRLRAFALWRLFFFSILAIAMIFFGRPLAAAWYANLGSLYQTQAELSEVEESTRKSLIEKATFYFERTLVLNPSHPIASRRLGMLALNRNEFETAVTYLEQAYAQEPHNQATLKALGYAYLWTGQPDLAYNLFQQVDFKSRLLEELDYWQGQWQIQGREDLAEFAAEMVERAPRKWRFDRP